jgi:putative glutamine amidotransferase
MAGSAPAPLILVTGGDRSGHAPRRLVTLALRIAGARTVSLTPKRAPLALEPDGVVITGGHDVDPVLYASAPEVQPRYDPARDKLESAVIDQALADGRPLLGICRGAQLLNVRLGGSLHQELRSRRRRTSNRWTIFPLKTLRVEAGSRLEAVLGSQEASINSLHNQGIDRLGTGLRVVGRDLDQIVQAVESVDHPFLMGVQWHPEFLIYQRSQMRLFRALVEAARTHRASRAE